MLDHNTLEQVRGIFAALAHKYTFRITSDAGDAHLADVKEFFGDVASTSDNISVETVDAAGAELRTDLLRDGGETRIAFMGIPNGHEFTSMLLAILNADGKGKNLPDESLARRIAAIKGPVELDTYVSLTCTNCPDIVQALNIVALYNPGIVNAMIDGGYYPERIKNLNIQAVPTVYANGEMLHVGRSTLGELVGMLEDRFGMEAPAEGDAIERDYDVIVLGGGPAGAAAAIYSARKGRRTAVVAKRIGGQVKETVGIENLISVPQTTGAKLADDLREHIGDYPVEVFEDRDIDAVSLTGDVKEVKVKGGETFRAPQVIIATGAGWRHLNVPGEKEYTGRGVAFCPHCDGPFYAGKSVAVIGGGNSGVEAALDLSAICSHVTVIEFLDSLKADGVLQDKLRATPNIDVYTSTETVRIDGNGKKVDGITVRNRQTGEQRTIPLDGVFVQIGLSANSAPFSGQLDTTRIGEIVVDASCRTAVKGVYAAGDVSNVPYKQIVIAMGEGAKAALSAFDDVIRGVCK
ncbi:MAG: alkyl hydroperoxide reductase subunit F [Candidatus Amulumruptor caecigallinarius]|uniref:Alkyl hydroperoxide reductase subunit F n=1 Tax=Candidatus Amulumruptor caecigallinarius TaxID=2109911 RepID=A0A4Q0U6X0_9BACT|nr:MAG: alkyl hydroperoxide reductase subunit F [Candidatus Amulumruptor caecigallinarius]HJE38194.1 alkyl hydroperoxide reductase subunit F [Candidatus Amulumruptor caecigallinarius]